MALFQKETCYLRHPMYLHQDSRGYNLNLILLTPLVPTTTTTTHSRGACMSGLCEKVPHIITKQTRNMTYTKLPARLLLV